jgi:anthranilate/para-aminobenzoate synthase component I
MSEDELMNTPISDLNEEQIQQGIKKIQEEIREGASA